MGWEQIGVALGYIIVGAGGVLAVWARREGSKARDDAETKAAKAEGAKSDAEGALYTLMMDRLRHVEGEVHRLTIEVEKERQLRVQLEQHIFHLENAMRSAGIDPPARPFVLG